jgi:hypothetical protein
MEGAPREVYDGFTVYEFIDFADEFIDFAVQNK